jgi:hypothetical protein
VGRGLWSRSGVCRTAKLLSPLAAAAAQHHTPADWLLWPSLMHEGGAAAWLRADALCLLLRAVPRRRW